jgi:hypothetical protein
VSSGRAVLATLLPTRRARSSARKVKCATSRYLNRDDGRPAAPTTITAIDIAVRTPPIDLAPRPRRYPPSRTPRPPTRRQQITEIMNADSRRSWSGWELAERLQVKPRNMLTQLGPAPGWLTRTDTGPTPSTRRRRSWTSHPAA